MSRLFCTFVSQMSTLSIRLMVEENGMRFGKLVTNMCGAFSFVVFQVHLEIIRWTPLKMASNTKTIDHGCKRTKI